MKIETLYIVTKPTAVSTLRDIMFEADAARLALQFRGGLEADQIAGMFTEQGEARRVAIDLLDTIGEAHAEATIDLAADGRALYDAALRADEAYTRAIKLVSGGKRDRWTLSADDDSAPEVKAALTAKIAADLAWQTWQRATAPSGDSNAPLSLAERQRVEAARATRTNNEWPLLEVVACSCGQKFYREHPQQHICRDCMTADGTAFSFYPTTEVAR